MSSLRCPTTFVSTDLEGRKQTCAPMIFGNRLLGFLLGAASVGVLLTGRAVKRRVISQVGAPRRVPSRLRCWWRGSGRPLCPSPRCVRVARKLGVGFGGLGFLRRGGLCGRRSERYNSRGHGDTPLNQESL